MEEVVLIATHGLVWVPIRLLHMQQDHSDNICPPPINEPVHEISNNVVFATIKASDQPAHTRSLIRAFARHLNIL